MSFKAISAALQKEGIIRYRGYFELIGRMQGISRRVRIGFYGLSTNMNLWEVLEALRKGKIIEYEVVIPEGYNLYQIGWTLSGTPLISDPQQFIRLVKNKEYVRSSGIEADTLEGYLFPGHLLSPEGHQARGDPAQNAPEIPGGVRRQLPQPCGAIGVHGAADPYHCFHCGKGGKGLLGAQAHLCCISQPVEEGHASPGRSHLRLRDKAWITQVTKQDLRRVSPYNTYLHKGLPPGPIANPGQGAILAALYPEPVDYLFFVAQGDGSHFFSQDYGSHEKAVGRYRTNKRNAKKIKTRQQAGAKQQQ